MGTAALFVTLLAFSVTQAYMVQTPTITLLEPKGIQFAYPDDGANLVSYHYNINIQLTGVAAGEYNADVNTPTNGYFIYEDTSVDVGPGDVVYYWVNVITDSGGYLLTDQSWTAEEPTTTAKSTTTTAKSTTTTATTAATSTAQPSNSQTISATTTKTTTASNSGGGGNGGTVVVTSDACGTYPCDPSCDATIAPCNGLIFEENWDTFDMTRWQHEITMSGGGNWEFQYYTNNRSNSYVRDNTLYIKPVIMAGNLTNDERKWMIKQYLTMDAEDDEIVTLTADHYGETFLSSGTLDLWGGSPADLCTGNSFWGCSRTGTGSNYINPIQSARIRSVNSFSFTYGRVEVEAKMPQGDWIWPAIWLLPRDNSYGGWPASGEMDIIESRGNTNLKDENGQSKGCDNMGSTLHWGPYWPINGYEKTTQEAQATSGTFASDFHKFTMDWKKDSIKFSIDDSEIANFDPGDQGFWEYGQFDEVVPGADNPWKNTNNKLTPFDKDFYFVMNLAVGGTNGFFQDTWTNSPYAKPWSNTSPTAMRDFWLQKNNWYPTWQPDVNNGENAALQVKTIRVWANY